MSKHPITLAGSPLNEFSSLCKRSEWTRLLLNVVNFWTKLMVCSRRYMPRRLAISLSRITETDILFSFTKTLFGQKNKSRYTTTSS